MTCSLVENMQKNDCRAIVPYSPNSQLEGRTYKKLPASHEEGKSSTAQTVVNAICCLIAIGLIVSGAVLDGINQPGSSACSTPSSNSTDTLPPCNPQLQIAGRAMWITGTSIIGLQVAIIACFCCVIGSAGLGALCGMK